MATTFHPASSPEPACGFLSNRTESQPTVPRYPGNRVNILITQITTKDFIQSKFMRIENLYKSSANTNTKTEQDCECGNARRRLQEHNTAYSTLRL